MALITIGMLEGRTPGERREISAAVRSAVAEALSVPGEDPVVRLIEHHPDNFLRPFPDRHSESYTLVMLTIFQGRSMQARRRLYAGVVQRLGAFGVPPDDVAVVVQEVPMENWGVRGGVPASEVDVGFRVDV